MPQEHSPKTLGIIFPLLPHHARRFFDENKSVFVKFYGKSGKLCRIKPGSKLFFYESKGHKEITGEATISAVSTARVDEVTSKFGQSLFLTSDELAEYAKNREDKTMLVLVLRNAKKYGKPLRIRKPITMAGRYMTDDLRKNFTTVIGQTAPT